jgi:hypothetical protein
MNNSAESNLAATYHFISGDVAMAKISQSW